MIERNRSNEHRRQDLEALVEAARGGDSAALEHLARAIQHPIFGLAMRMLGEPAEAEDATQEILIKVITRLDRFHGQSRFTTWVYAVAANHLRTLRAGVKERRNPSFEQMSERQARVLPDAVEPTAERQVLTREIRLICLHGLLLCLDREHRLTYVLSEAMELSGEEGAQVLGIRPGAFRKRLSRARQRLRAFMLAHCGLVRAENRCRCELWYTPVLDTGTVDPQRPKFAGHPVGDHDDSRELAKRLADLDELKRIRTLFRTLPQYRAPDRLLERLTEMLTIERDTPLRA